MKQRKGGGWWNICMYESIAIACCFVLPCLFPCFELAWMQEWVGCFNPLNRRRKRERRRREGGVRFLALFLEVRRKERDRLPMDGRKKERERKGQEGETN